MLGGSLQRADLTTRAVAGFVDLLIIIGLARLPDVLGFLFASGYILIRDGLFNRRSIGKKLIGLRVTASDEAAPEATYRESIIRNAPFAVAYLLFLIPYAGWCSAPWPWVWNAWPLSAMSGACASAISWRGPW